MASLAVGQVGLLLQTPRMPVDLVNEALDSNLIAVERHLLAVLCNASENNGLATQRRSRGVPRAGGLQVDVNVNVNPARERNVLNLT